MPNQISKIQSISLEQELKNSYLDYAMSVIVGRALPDCRDGLKPVHRRILYAMHELGNTAQKPYKKSARIVGDVHGKYHPHGESSIYDAIVRMAQDFSIRYEIIDGQGNFGSVDGDPPAAARYTEVRLKPYGMMMMEDIDKDTVNFSPNYDGSEKIPDLLPTKVPNFLINGTSGIAVGMATQTPPHRLSEVLGAFLYFIDHQDATVDELMEYLPGPDFPTGGQILGKNGIKLAYATGRGKIKIRAVTEIEEQGTKRSIIVKELPYQVNKARLIEKIAELAREKKIEGISALRDESDKEGMRIVIDLKRETNEQVLLNNLYQNTQMQNVFGINMVGLLNAQPQTFTLRKIFQEFLIHRQELLIRRTKFELNKSRVKAHSLEGLSIALDNLDEMIELIKASENSAQAKAKLVGRLWPAQNLLSKTSNLKDVLIINECLPYGHQEHGYLLSTKQAETILEMKLHRLTSMEQDKIRDDFNACIDQIEHYCRILSSNELRIDIIKQETAEIMKTFTDNRRTEILDSDDQPIENEDLITPEDVVVTVSEIGYIKTQPLNMFESQRRGGKGKSATKLKEEDSISHLLVAHSHDHLLCFTSHGKVFKLRVFELPSGSRHAAGKPVVNFLPLAEGENLTALLPIKDFAKQSFIFMATKLGTVKKVELQAFSSTRSSGVIALTLDDGDTLEHVFLTTGQEHIMLFASNGKAIKFHEDEVRQTGRTSRGVRGIKLSDDSYVVSSIAIAPHEEEQLIITASEHGFGKCTYINQYTPQFRGGLGVIAMSCSTRNGLLVGALVVDKADEIMFLSEQGMILRTTIENISISSRNTQGVKLVSLAEHDKLKKIQKITSFDESIEPAVTDHTAE